MSVSSSSFPPTKPSSIEPKDSSFSPTKPSSKELDGEKSNFRQVTVLPTSSSVKFSLPVPSLDTEQLEERLAGLKRKQWSQPPPTPSKRQRKKSIFSNQEEEQKQELKSYTNPKIVQGLETLASDGQYKIAWKMPEDSALPSLVPGIENEKILVLTFKHSERYNPTAGKIKQHFENTIKQYKEAKKAFGEDRCVVIYNIDSAQEDKALIVEKIERSLKDEFIHLQELVEQKLLKRFESMKDLEKPLDENQLKALNLLQQLKWFYDRSIENKIDTDIHIGNFRLKKDESGKDKLILADFRESIDIEDFAVNKRTEFRNYKSHLALIFSPKFLDEYFKESLEKLDRENCILCV